MFDQEGRSEDFAKISYKFLIKKIVIGHNDNTKYISAFRSGEKLTATVKSAEVLFTPELLSVSVNGGIVFLG